ncbi:MAG: hypothetical protein OXI65_02985 [Acidobacteriota bacterium]|nr:hypothetical protein [Acidobacteriota bacterium]
MPIAPLTATAAVVLRGFVAERSLLAALVLVLSGFGAGVLVSDASLGPGARFESNVAWVFAEVLGWSLALTHGAGVVGGRGVLGAFGLARPVSSGLLLAGRFLGLAAGLLLYVAVVGATLSAWLAVAHGSATAAVPGIGWLLWLRLLVILAVSTLFLALVRPAVAIALAVLFSLAGWLAGSLPAAGPAYLQPVTRLAALVLPDLSALDAPIAGIPGSLSEAAPMLVGPTVYAILYAVAMVAAAIAVFPWWSRQPGARFLE